MQPFLSLVSNNAQNHVLSMDLTTCILWLIMSLRAMKAIVYEEGFARTFKSVILMRSPRHKSQTVHLVIIYELTVAACQSSTVINFSAAALAHSEGDRFTLDRSTLASRIT